MDRITTTIKIDYTTKNLLDEFKTMIGATTYNEALSTLLKYSLNLQLGELEKFNRKLTQLYEDLYNLQSEIQKIEKKRQLLLDEIKSLSSEELKKCYEDMTKLKEENKELHKKIESLNDALKNKKISNILNEEVIKYIIYNIIKTVYAFLIVKLGIFDKNEVSTLSEKDLVDKLTSQFGVLGGEVQLIRDIIKNYEFYEQNTIVDIVQKLSNEIYNQLKFNNLQNEKK